MTAQNIRDNENQLIITRDNLSSMLHTALRKCCDSEITSAAWNMFHVLDNDTISKFYDIVWAKLEKDITTESNQQQVLAAVQNAVLDDFDFTVSAGTSLMHCIFSLFKKYDWIGYCTYINQGRN